MQKSLTILILILGLGLAQSPHGGSPARKRTLVLIDNMLLHTTHSSFFKDLQNNGHKLSVKYVREDLVSSGHLRLSQDKEYLYDNLILMCTSLTDLPTTKNFNIRQFFDDGNNVMFMFDFDTSYYFRKLAMDFGFKLHDKGSYVMDYQNAFDNRSPNVFKIRQFKDIDFIGEDVQSDVVYNGIGLTLTHFANQQMTIFARGNLHSASIKYDDQGTKSYLKMGKHNILVLGIQGFDNARAVVSGSLDMFSNELYSLSKGANRDYAMNLVGWLSQERGVVKKVADSYSCIDAQGNDSDCPVRCNFRFSIDVSFNLMDSSCTGTGRRTIGSLTAMTMCSWKSR